MALRPTDSELSLEPEPEPQAPPPRTPPPPALDPPTLGPQPPDGRQLSYAQQGEDLIVRQALSALGLERPSYLDVGAFHPTIGSNTYLLYAAGGRGVLVEPNPFMAKMLEEVRPEDTVLNAGIGFNDEKEADYFLIRDRPQLNTFSREQVDRYIARSGPAALEKTLRMKLLRIVEVIEEHFEGAPDFVSIDVEGLDLEIMQTFDFARHRPAVFCIESAQFGATGVVEGIVELMRGHDYLVRGGSMINTVFVDAKRLEAAAPEGARVHL